jgi:hypothetical protein
VVRFGASRDASERAWRLVLRRDLLAVAVELFWCNCGMGYFWLIKLKAHLRDEASVAHYRVSQEEMYKRGGT